MGGYLLEPVAWLLCWSICVIYLVADYFLEPVSWLPRWARIFWSIMRDLLGGRLFAEACWVTYSFSEDLLEYNALITRWARIGWSIMRDLLGGQLFAEACWVTYSLSEDWLEYNAWLTWWAVTFWGLLGDLLGERGSTGVGWTVHVLRDLLTNKIAQAVLWRHAAAAVETGVTPAAGPILCTKRRQRTSQTLAPGKTEHDSTSWRLRIDRPSHSEEATKGNRAAEFPHRAQSKITIRLSPKQLKIYFNVPCIVFTLGDCHPGLKNWNFAVFSLLKTGTPWSRGRDDRIVQGQTFLPFPLPSWAFSSIRAHFIAYPGAPSHQTVPQSRSVSPHYQPIQNS